MHSRRVACPEKIDVDCFWNYYVALRLNPIWFVYGKTAANVAIEDEFR